MGFLSENRRVFLAFLAVLVIMFASFGIVSNLEHIMSSQAVAVIGQRTLVSGSTASFRVIVTNLRNMHGVRNAELTISARVPEREEAVNLFSGRTDKTGSASIQFDVPLSMQGDYELIVEADSSLGKDTIRTAIKIDRLYRIFLTTDKPLYQPGQTIHIRALSLHKPGLEPVQYQDITIEVEDPKGNKVFKKTEKTSAYGIGSADFTLGNEINLGTYTVRALLGRFTAEKKITVSRYVLPKFSINLETDKEFYLPSETVKGKVTANYFFGKPVTEADVNVDIYTAGDKLSHYSFIEGKTDSDGTFGFEFLLPSYFPDLNLYEPNELYFNITVTDQAQHTQTYTDSVTLTQDVIVIDVIPESGVLEKNIENRVYIITSYPNYRGAVTTITVDGREYRTDEYGIASIVIKPKKDSIVLDITARDDYGRSASARKTLSTTFRENSLLVRTDKAIYKVGDTLHLDIFSTGSETIYVDFIRDSQIMLTKSVSPRFGRASLSVDIDESMQGTIDINAYQLNEDFFQQDYYSGYRRRMPGMMEEEMMPVDYYTGSPGYTQITIRDSRRIFVNPADELRLDIKPDKAVYLPGEHASILFSATHSGKAVPAAIGVNIVDESVFAIQDMQPGMERVFFLLEQQLLNSSLNVNGYTFPDMLTKNYSMDRVADVLLAKTEPPSQTLVLGRTSPDRSNVYRYKSDLFTLLLHLSSVILLLIPLAGLGVTFRRMNLSETFVNILISFGTLALIIGAFFSLIILHITPLTIILVLVFLYFLIRLLANMWNFARIKNDSALYRILALLPVYIVFWSAFIILLIMTGFSYVSVWMLVSAAVSLLLIILMCITNYINVRKEQKAVAVQVEKAGIPFGLQVIGAIGFLVFIIVFLVVPLLFGGMKKMGSRESLRYMAEEPGVAGVTKSSILDRMMPEGRKLAEAPPQFVDELGFLGMVTEDQTNRNVRVRKYFPETLYSNPELVTDSSGNAQIELDMADSITDWRVTSMANSINGDLGSSTAHLVVFQDFFIDLDLPVMLTQNDIISLPVAIYNYLKESQEIKIEFEEQPWFEMLDRKEKSVTLKPNDISVLYFRIRAKEVGTKRLTVRAFGRKMSDAISREIEVVPDGKDISRSVSGRLSGTVTKTVLIPENAISNSGKLVVKIYPGFFSQVVEGLDKVLRMPSGCFEQTSSTTYPNVMVYDYMKRTNQLNPELQAKAETYISSGYQRLLTFETDTPGGFSLFGRSPPETVLTAYGLMEFTDMSRVHSVDLNVLKRMQDFLVSRQNPDGSWDSGRGLETGQHYLSSKIQATCYVMWALAHSGRRDNLFRPESFISSNLDLSDTDTYTLAMCANALEEYRPSNPYARNIMDEIDSRKVEDSDTIYWPESDSEADTFMGGYGRAKEIETTAMAALAYLKLNYRINSVQKMLNYIIAQKDSFGTWHTTQSTVLSMKALIGSMAGVIEGSSASVLIKANDNKQHSIVITPETCDVTFMVDLSRELNNGENNITISFDGSGNIFYQIVPIYYLKWEDYFKLPESASERIGVTLNYEKDTLNQNELITVEGSAFYKSDKSNFVVIDIGVPPGFNVLPGNLPELLGRGVISRYDVHENRIFIYVRDMNERGVKFEYGLQPRYPGEVSTLLTNIWDYYAPQTLYSLGPSKLRVV